MVCCVYKCTTFYREEYERNIARVESKQGKYLKATKHGRTSFWYTYSIYGAQKNQCTGNKTANKVMLLSAMAYNLKKYLKFITKTVKSEAKSLCLFFIQKKELYNGYNCFYRYLNFMN